jgi:hypothetical protein
MRRGNRFGKKLKGQLHRMNDVGAVLAAQPLTYPNHSHSVFPPARDDTQVVPTYT